METQVLPEGHGRLDISVHASVKHDRTLAEEKLIGPPPGGGGGAKRDGSSIKALFMPKYATILYEKRRAAPGNSKIRIIVERLGGLKML